MLLNPLRALDRWAGKIGRTNLLLLALLTLVMWWVSH
jgi:hypothetical protein